jgi:hypothetical protein
MCQVLRSEFLLLEPCRNAGFDFIEGAFKRAIGCVTIRKGGGNAWAQEAVVGAGEEQGGAEAKRGDAVAEAVGNFFDNPMKPQAAKPIGRSALGDIEVAGATATRLAGLRRSLAREYASTTLEAFDLAGKITNHLALNGKGPAFARSA